MRPCLRSPEKGLKYSLRPSRHSISRQSGCKSADPDGACKEMHLLGSRISVVHALGTIVLVYVAIRSRGLLQVSSRSLGTFDTLLVLEMSIRMPSAQYH